MRWKMFKRGMRAPRLVQWRTACLAVLAMLAAPGASADFGAPATLSEGTFGKVGVDADGDAYVVWAATNRSQGRARSRTGVLGPIQDISILGFSPQVYVQPNGSALLVWHQQGSVGFFVQARRRSAAGALGPVKTISVDASFTGVKSAALDADGDAVIVWERSGASGVVVEVRALSAAGALGPIQSLGPGNRPDIAMEPDGDAVIVWEVSDGTRTRIRARTRSAAGALGASVFLSGTQLGSFSPDIEMDADGDALVVWKRFVSPNTHVQSRRRAKTGALGPIVTHATTADSNSGTALFALDRQGDALLVWTRLFGVEPRVQMQTLSRTGALGSIRSISGAGTDARFPRVASDGVGDAVVLWQNGEGPDFRIRARNISRAGVPGGFQTLSGTFSQTASIAMNADGDAIAVWQRAVGGKFFIQAAAGP